MTNQSIISTVESNYNNNNTTLLPKGIILNDNDKVLLEQPSIILPNVTDYTEVGNSNILDSVHVSEGPGRIAKAPVPSIYIDDRGDIHRLRVGGSRINILYTKKAYMRSGYFHPHTIYHYIVNGIVQVWTLTNVGTNKVIYSNEQSFTIPPYTPHILFFIHDTTMIEYYDKNIEFICYYYHPYRNIVDVQNSQASNYSITTNTNTNPISNSNSNSSGQLTSSQQQQTQTQLTHQRRPSRRRFQRLIPQDEIPCNNIKNNSHQNKNATTTTNREAAFGSNGSFDGDSNISNSNSNNSNNDYYSDDTIDDLNYNNNNNSINTSSRHHNNWINVFVPSSTFLTSTITLVSVSTISFIGGILIATIVNEYHYNKYNTTTRNK